MESVWDICYAVLKDGCWWDRGPIYTELLFGAAMKDWQSIVSRTPIFKSDSVRFVCFLPGICSMVRPVCCVLVPGTLLASHLLYKYTLINCDCLVYSVSQ